MHFKCLLCLTYVLQLLHLCAKYKYIITLNTLKGFLSNMTSGYVLFYNTFCSEINFIIVALKKLAAVMGGFFSRKLALHMYITEKATLLA